MAADVVVELIGNIIEGACEFAFHRARGWDLFWRIVIVFIVIPAVIIGLYCWLT